MTYWDWSLVPVKDSAGAVAGLVLTMTDVTERQREKEELRKHREYLGELVEEQTKEIRKVNEKLRMEIEERKRAEEQQQVALKVLRILNTAKEQADMLGDIIRVMKEFSKCSAMAIRVCQGNDFPYSIVSGFPQEFVRLESSLCAVDEQGDVCRDSEGNPILECMCGMVVSGRTDSAKPFFTAGGSFWTNSTTELLNFVSEEEKQAMRMRGRCHATGYESVALIPLKSGAEVIGLLQFNDERRNRFTPQFIEFYEGLGQSIGIALMEKQVREKLQKSEARLAEAQRIAHIGSWELDLISNKLTWSDEVYRMFGLEPQQFGATYEAFLDNIHPDDREIVGKAYTESVKNKTPYDIVHRLLLKDGTIKYVNERCETFYDDDGKPIRSIGTVQDITERKRAEEARIAAERELEEQRALSMRTDRLRSLGQMAAGIAHELNQPLVGVRGLAEHTLIAMERGWEVTEEKLKERLTTIVEQADRMSHIIEHVRMFARETGKPELQLVQVNDVVEAAMDMLGAQFRSRGIKLKCELAEDLPPVLANPFSLEEVVLNLIINARDAVEERLEMKSHESLDSSIAPPRVLLRTFLQRESDEERAKSNRRLRLMVKIEVVDWGIGIPEDILPNVFDPFFTTKEPNQGTGLGLSISQSIVEQFEGRMDIQSTLGQGTTVTISLPPEQHIGRSNNE